MGGWSDAAGRGGQDTSVWLQSRREDYEGETNWAFFIGILVFNLRRAPPARAGWALCARAGLRMRLRGLAHVARVHGAHALGARAWRGGCVRGVGGAHTTGSCW